MGHGTPRDGSGRSARADHPAVLHEPVWPARRPPRPERSTRWARAGRILIGLALALGMLGLSLPALALGSWILGFLLLLLGQLLLLGEQRHRGRPAR